MRAILDTCVLISGHFGLDPSFDVAVTALSYAELEYGTITPSATEQARRRARLQQLRQHFGDGLPFDDRAGISYGILTTLTVRSNRQVRGRQMDLLIAAIAHANQTALVTENGDDFTHLASVIPVLTPFGIPW